MKIYFTGAHASGKSTLARYVEKKYNLPMITEVARKILSERETNLNDLRISLEATNDYQSEVFKRQIEAESKLESFVSDRCLDCLAYTAQHASNLHEIVKTDYFKQYVEKLRDPKNIIFFVKPSRATLKADGVRENLDWDGVVTIDSMIKTIYKIYDIHYYMINVDSMQERIHLVENIISLL